MRHIRNWVKQKRIEDFKSGTEDTLREFYPKEFNLGLEGVKHPHRGVSAILSWESDLEEAFRNCLLGKSEPNFKLFSIDPGLGKTTAAARFLKKYKDDEFRLGGSVLILVSRITEVQTYLDASGLDEGDYAVLVSDHPIMHKGRGYKHTNRARILFTTQQMFSSRVQGGRFADVEDFHYRDAPRTLRIWDETLVPATPVSLRLDALKALPASLRPVVPDFIDALEPWLDVAKKAPDRSAVHVPPALKAEAKAALDHRLDRYVRKDAIAAVKGLEAVAGTDVEIFTTSYHGQTMAGCQAQIPDDLAPLIILDASGSARGTYDLWARYGSGLNRMPPVRSSYENLVVSVHKIGSGKSAMKDAKKRASILKIAVDLVGADADEWLLIHHKEDGTTIADEVRVAVSSPSRIKSIHWGDHHGTNDYRHIKKVLVLGIMTYPPATYRAMHMASAGLGAAGINDEECEDLKRAELMHHLLQGISRCNVRNHSGGICGDAAVYVLGAAQFDPINIIRETFPGSRVREWVPLSPKLKGRANEVVVEVRRALDASGGKPISKKAVRDAVGIDRPALAKLLRREAVKAHLSADGVRIEHDHFWREAEEEDE